MNTGSGVITRIDLTNGRLVVTSNNGRTVELEINDPNGRFGRPHRPRATTAFRSTREPHDLVRYGLSDVRTSHRKRYRVPGEEPPSSTAAGGCRDFITGVGITPPTGGAGVSSTAVPTAARIPAVASIARASS